MSGLAVGCLEELLGGLVGQQRGVRLRSLEVEVDVVARVLERERAQGVGVADARA